ncbi:SET domain-containing protein [Thelephora ganbajun]|uniref:SET domain-containing protein n=1 Tax=Thelephora ganbajun TaxID=370292 RepID=A0ACB6ZSV0_THEGA|nr:SET domain-containing protein [Thelephora ganbajun]
MAEERILDTYRSVWNGFYSWETEYSSEVIASLATDTPAQDASSAEDSCFSQDIDILSFRHLKRPISGIPLSPPRVLPVVQAHSRYQACAPSNQNVMAKRSNYNPFVTPLFIPFADEPRFQSKYFLEEFLQDSDYTDPKLRWQSLPDPDFEIIQLQTLFNLRKLGYTVSQIDAEMVLPQAEMPDTDADGLLWACEQRHVSSPCPPALRVTIVRDLLEWPGMLRNTGDDVHVTEKWDVISRVDSMLRQFCPLLGCIQSACPSHVHDRKLNRNIRPMLNNDSLRQGAKKSCNNMCFTLESDDYIEVAPRELMTKDVISLIKLLPDELPCHLAGLCRLSCRDVFAYRSELFSSMIFSGPIRSDIPSHDPGPPDKSWFRDCRPVNPWMEFTAGKVCDHEGPCHKPTRGECHCYIRCTCVWRRTGFKNPPCQASNGEKRSKCECQAAFRECDPEMCPCYSRKLCTGIKGYCCANVSLQQGRIKPLDVAAAQYGLGAFTAQYIKKGGFIGEYVGEIYYNYGHTSRAYLNRYTGLNYLFDLNRSQALDALTVGNETRYLNHDEQCNVTASAWLVNDEHRIAYYATKSVAKNKELFLDYGERYWAEGSFEDYLAEREERKISEEGQERILGQDDGEFTYGSDTAEGT